MRPQDQIHFNIRRMRITDTPHVVDIVHRALGPFDARKAKKDFGDQSRKLYREGEIFVATLEKKIVGVIGYWRLNHHPKDIVWLDWFAVDTDCQKRGIGSALLGFMIKVLRKKNKRMLCVEASSKNSLHSKQFYSLHRFKEVGEIKKYWDDGGDLVFLVKKV